jgi:hypothetical protein
MTATEYQEYTGTVIEWLAGFEGEPSAGYWACPECGGELDCERACTSEDCPVGCTYTYNEPSFSWSTCPCCDSQLGGDRIDMIGWLKGATDPAGWWQRMKQRVIIKLGEPLWFLRRYPIKRQFTEDYQWEGAICCDCEYWFAYGQLDDMTMMDIEEEVTA